MWGVPPAGLAAAAAMSGTKSRCSDELTSGSFEKARRRTLGVSRQHAAPLTAAPFDLRRTADTFCVRPSSFP